MADISFVNNFLFFESNLQFRGTMEKQESRKRKLFTNEISAIILYYELCNLYNYVSQAFLLKIISESGRTNNSTEISKGLSVIIKTTLSDEPLTPFFIQ